MREKYGTLKKHKLILSKNQLKHFLGIAVYLASSDPSITTTMIGTRTSMLMINNVGYRHSGAYSCRASNHAGHNELSLIYTRK